MKRFFFVAVAAVALLMPTLASAQEWKLVYRPELHGMVTVRVPQAPAEPTVAAEKVAPSPADVIARHEAMQLGLRANANARGGAAVATDHCQRLIAAARETIRQQF